ncbi:hypothetical protein [Haliea sp.]|uniref:DUF7064 domain-containing protein n=1 Tax=Haliea sp. TaxID=1932666 RepID=UPI000C3D1816|nr:hypothetical protein [Haliea sp.]HCD56580.1 hypothetical protein [Halieaceae bacterium]MAD62143.1 hypothetical protein [Haliea sp.]MAY93854.1 hypothetical protein [Haliea sp.]MBK41613.1 hypothetical protein [Haliea sp.]MBP70875.1 hypothetical protein [Haliea sp.]
MIRPGDVEFHTFPEEDRDTWAETNYFPFSIVEEGISGSVYNVFRPGLGVCLGDVTIFDRCACHWEGLAYTDNQQHMPCPESLVSYELRNGVSVECLDAPGDYRVSYQGIDETRFQLTFSSVMRPQDLNDPDQDPITRIASAPGQAWDDAFNGHFDMTAHVTGELILRGQHFAVDCYATIDHSWGPRLERDNSSAVVVQAYFGSDIALHLLAAFDPTRERAIGPAYHGYVLRQGRVIGVVSASGEVTRKRMFPLTIEVNVEDEEGNRYCLTGQMQNWAPWAPYNSVIYYSGLALWQLDGRTGYGPYQEILSRAFVARHKLSN